MILHPKSHTDHVSPAILELVLQKFAHKTEFFIETFTLPPQDTIACTLYGPTMGDPPITEDMVIYQKRPERIYNSRLIKHPSRAINTVTVIAGPYAEFSCALYTVYGGFPAPKELADPSLAEKDREAAEDFWAAHALATD